MIYGLWKHILFQSILFSFSCLQNAGKTLNMKFNLRKPRDFLSSISYISVGMCVCVMLETFWTYRKVERIALWLFKNMSAGHLTSLSLSVSLSRIPAGHLWLPPQKRGNNAVWLKPDYGRQYTVSLGFTLGACSLGALAVIKGILRASVEEGKNWFSLYPFKVGAL